MYPFINLIESDALMTSHCLYKSFDELPSTLSHVLLTDVLRKEIGFKGLIISDGMEMKAISDVYGIGKGSVMALNAGCDILLLCHEYEEQKASFDAVLEAVKNGEIDIELLKEKVSRINLAKEKILNKVCQYFKDEDYVINQEEHQLMESIVDNSFTLISGAAPKIDHDTIIISCNAKVGSIVEDEFDERNLTNALKHNFPNNVVLKFRSEESFVDEALNLANNYQNIIIYSYDAYRDDVQKTVINKLLETNKNVSVVSIKGPIDRIYFKNLINYACLYEYTPNSIKTIVKQLKGHISLNGKLPL